MADPRKRLSRVLTDLHHGGHAVSGVVQPADTAVVTPEAAPLGEVTEDWASDCLDDRTTPFDYLFGDLRDAYPAGHLPVEPASEVVAALKALGTAMVDQPIDATPNSTIPPVYTYWGQFLDHDITANTDRDTTVSIVTDPLTPIEPGFVKSLVRNLREPALNLDSVYGNGPDAPDVPKEVPYDGPELRIGQLTPGPPVPVGGADLPRVKAGEEDAESAIGTARIGDSRNDENLIIAQLHLAFLRFHNEVLKWLAINEPELETDEERFARARQLTTWHYQAIVVEDFLRRIAKGSVVDDVLADPVDDKVRRSLPGGGTEVFMPLEHSVAAYRFGHSMVRARYDHNENFGRPEPAPGGAPLDDPDPDNPKRATFAEMFQFTGGGVIHVPPRPGQPFALPSFPDNWPIRWRRFTDGGFPDRFARKIDTHLAPPLTELSNEGNLKADGTPETDVRVKRILKRLAVRNLLRGYRLGIPTGQAVAAALGVTPLTQDELLRVDTSIQDGQDDVGEQGVADALVDGGFLDATPLWFYVLKEAEVQEHGERLGEVGSRIVCTTIIGQIQADPDSYLNREGGAWSTAEGVKLANGGEVKTIAAFLDFAKVLDVPPSA